MSFVTPFLKAHTTPHGIHHTIQAETLLYGPLFPLAFKPKFQIKLCHLQKRCNISHSRFFCFASFNLNTLLAYDLRWDVLS